MFFFLLVILFLWVRVYLKETAVGLFPYLPCAPVEGFRSSGSIFDIFNNQCLILCIHLFTNYLLSVYYGQAPFEVKGIQPWTKQAKERQDVCGGVRVNSSLLGSVSCLPAAASSSLWFWMSLIIRCRDNIWSKSSCKSYFFFWLDLSNYLVLLCSEKIQHFSVLFRAFHFSLTDSGLSIGLETAFCSHFD